MKGIIIVNPYKIPAQSISQAERLIEEFISLGAKAEIVSDAYSRAFVDKGGVFLDKSFQNADFFVYLDKDKYVSDILERAGKRVFDMHKTIRECDDKGETYISLAAGGFSVPKTLFAPLCYSKDLAALQGFTERIERELSYPIIVKESYGSMGKGVFKAENRKELTEISEKLKCSPHLYQEYACAERGTDMRVIVVGGTAAAAMLRVNEKDFRSNIALGGKGIKIDLDKVFEEHGGSGEKSLACNDLTCGEKFFACGDIKIEITKFIATAERAAQYLKADYCGVDLLIGNDGEPIICEVNSNAFFEEIEKVTGVNVAARYAKYILFVCRGM